jgi:ribosomal protein S18 acetylase RimI-like enzyme
MTWDQLLAPGVTVRDSPLETGRFGCSITRVTIGSGPVDPEQLLDLISEHPGDVLIVRYDASRLDLPGTFARSRRAVVAAGALTYWEKPVSAAGPPAGQNLEALQPDRLEPEVLPANRPDLEVLPADGLDLETVTATVRQIVRASFLDYGNHYTANPLLDHSAALAGYEDWAVRTLRETPGNVLVMTDLGEPVGLATLEPGDDGRHLEILLAGLIPAAQGRRLYGALLDACESVAAARGAGRVVISTQVHNLRVQRAWARQGLRPFGAIETVHLIDRDLLLASFGNA